MFEKMYSNLIWHVIFLCIFVGKSIDPPFARAFIFMRVTNSKTHNYKGFISISADLIVEGEVGP